MYYRICKHILCTCLVLLAASCANRGIGPQGGPRDSLAPVIVRESPANGTLNFKGERIEVVFDEYIQLDKVQDNVLMSPPQVHPPEIYALGKKLLVRFNDPLRDSTTYTIDFGSAICDNNEKIPFVNYSYAFATGDKLDSLAIFGQVINAEDLNPMGGMTIGIHDVLDDSVFSGKPFTRIARSDSLGEFAIRNMRPGTYRLYALQDVSRDNIWQAGEGLAFADELVTPSVHIEVHADTIWRDTVINDSTVHLIDSIDRHEHRYLEPADLVLWFFREDKPKRYFQRALRKEPHCFRLFFGAPQDSLPKIEAPWMEHALIDANTTLDTITVWLTDSSVMVDTLQAQMTYVKTDSLYRPMLVTDTIRALYHAPNLTARTREKLRKREREKALAIQTNAHSPFKVNDTVRISFAAPLASLLTDSIHLLQKKDSLEIPVAYTVEPMDAAGRQYRLLASLEQNKSYILRIDSAAAHDIYGHANNVFEASFKLRSIEEYATLRIYTTPFDARMRLQLLSEQDKVVREAAASPQGVLFDYLDAKPYYLRMYFDLNGDGRWTTGDWSEKRQPEPVYYFPSKLALRANWDFEETFDYTVVPQLESKPMEIVKDGYAALNKKK